MSGMINEPQVRFVGPTKANPDYHHGELRPVVGVHNQQVMRANRAHPEHADGFGWTFNNAPMLAYWKGHFYLSYISTPVGENVTPSQALLTTSSCGRQWGKARVLFPPYPIPEGVYEQRWNVPLAPNSYAMMHHRSGFYVSADGRLLALGFYGISPDPDVMPNDGRGIGRVVREIYENGEFGPIYFLRVNRHAGWDESNIHYPMYTEADDQGFVASCEALLADRLATLQWWEEDRSTDGFFALPGEKALSYYHLEDGRAVGLWKWSRTAMTSDEGVTWTPAVESPSLVMAGAKAWGQRTSDGRYAMLYNPSPNNHHRWPLAVATSENGLEYDRLLLVNGEVPPQRYAGEHKYLGLNYVIGINECCEQPPDGNLWVAYNQNKEDIWVCRIAVPIRDRVTEAVNDSFAHLKEWNLYNTIWSHAGLGELPSTDRKCLRITHQDPADYTKAERVFPESVQAEIDVELKLGEQNGGRLYVEVQTGRNHSPVRMWLDGDGQLHVQHAKGRSKLAAVTEEGWVRLRIGIDVPNNRYTLAVNEGKEQEFVFLRAVDSVEKIVFRTGDVRKGPDLEDDHIAEDLPNADLPLAPTVYYLTQLRTGNHA